MVGAEPAVAGQRSAEPGVGHVAAAAGRAWSAGVAEARVEGAVVVVAAGRAAAESRAESVAEDVARERDVGGQRVAAEVVVAESRAATRASEVGWSSDAGAGGVESAPGLAAGYTGDSRWDRYDDSCRAAPGGEDSAVVDCTRAC